MANFLGKGFKLSPILYWRVTTCLASYHASYPVIGSSTFATNLENKKDEILSCTGGFRSNRTTLTVLDIPMCHLILHLLLMLNHKPPTHILPTLFSQHTCAHTHLFLCREVKGKFYRDIEMFCSNGVFGLFKTITQETERLWPYFILVRIIEWWH